MDTHYYTVQEYEDAVNRTPMTEAQINEMVTTLNRTNQMWSMRDFVRTIEERHGIK